MLAEERHRGDRPEEGSRRERARPPWRRRRDGARTRRARRWPRTRRLRARARPRMVEACGQWPPRAVAMMRLAAAATPALARTMANGSRVVRRWVRLLSTAHSPHAAAMRTAPMASARTAPGPTPSTTAPAMTSRVAALDARSRYSPKTTSATRIVSGASRFNNNDPATAEVRSRPVSMATGARHAARDRDDRQERQVATLEASLGRRGSGTSSRSSVPRRHRHTAGRRGAPARPTRATPSPAVRSTRTRRRQQDPRSCPCGARRSPHDSPAAPRHPGHRTSSRWADRRVALSVERLRLCTRRRG